MKNKKYYIKKNLISFIIGLIIFGGVGVYAAVTFPSNEVTYDNTDSGLSSTNVKGAIDELYNTCTALSPGEQIIEDNNLEKDEYECRYFFTGANPNNYITFNNESWRIISIECDGTIKIMRTASIGSQYWHAVGNNNWALPVSLNTYLNGTYYNGLNNAAKSQIVASNFGIGAVTYNNNNLANQVNDENKTKWNGKVALITASEYIRTNSNKNNCGTYSLIQSNYSSCVSTGWMDRTNVNNWWWTLTPRSGTSSNVIFVSQLGNFDIGSTYYYKNDVIPALYLSSEVQIIGGDGTQSNPYQISL